jgi:uncharacterized sulfatase
MKRLFFLLLTVLALPATAVDRPNFVWLLSEDNSKHYLKHFDPDGAPAPNIEKMAANGLTFDRAFSCAPVCSVARTTLATACYAPRIGTQYHRKSKVAPLPPGQKMWAAYLRQAGYYTTNNSKTDYNVEGIKDAWDMSSKKAHWRNRKDKSQPFYHMQTHGVSHESSLHFKKGVFDKKDVKTDPKSVKLADYHPDTELFRFTHARYHDRMKDNDNYVGKFLKQLEDDGVLEDTFVFYFGDHGGVLPRGKGYAYESGLHVPLVVRIPENFKHLVDGKKGDRVNGFVEFVDFGPTVLNLAAVKGSEGFDGTAFLGKGVTMAEVNSRDEAFGHADRFDEKFELVRTLRRGKFKYMRNYEGYLPDGLQNNYRYKMLAFEEWRQLFKAGKLNAAQRQFFEPKPPELLYDLEADPHEVNNLANDPKHADTLKQLRGRLQERLKAMPDLSFHPESVMVANAMANPTAYGKKHAADIASLIDTIDLALLPFDQAQPKLAAALKSDNAMQRYWALTACSQFGDAAKPLSSAAKASLTHDSMIVRTRAAEFLAIIGAADPQPVIKEALQKATSPVEVNIILNTVIYLRDAAPKTYPFKFSKGDCAHLDGHGKWRMEYLGW